MDIQPYVYMNIFNTDRQTDNKYKITPIDKLGEEKENKKHTFNL